ncbi:hypothetical protein [Hymenobacter latericus]|uniref:hypothetical protein n=1 Tax=Hymenobacter sp. YIM 151858-1 TaxID=2987688 RepID=UPI002227029E|nr:hypothetical protein [Hymenobacter sp. YIM 151858-1]UYZ57483.1 hypothetical protein OIS50_10420 [Hymenobacter sp. YIM 151858-1]
MASTALQKRVLREFIAGCHRERHFFEDKRIVQLTTYQDARGQLNWVVSALIDDRFKDNPTITYSLIDDTLILD